MAEQNKQKVSGSTSTNHEEKSKSLGQAIGETRAELKKVHWPKKEEVQKYTIVVITTVLFFSVAIYAIDSALGFAISKLISQ